MLTVLQVLEANEGGARRHVRDLALALDPALMRVCLAFSYERERDLAGREAAFASDRALGASLTDVPMRREVSPGADALALARLARCVRKERPDVLHAHSSKAGALARLVGLSRGVPVVYTPHVFPFQMICGPGRRFFYRMCERLLRGATAAVVAVSADEAREARQLGYAPERIFLIPNGVLPIAMEPVQVREGGPLTVGFFGRLCPQKGPDLLMEAMSEVVAHLPQTQLRLFGGGSAEALRAEAAARKLTSQVIFEGACPPEAVIARMRETDVIAMPSRWEGCPYTVIEAFQAGTPVVAAAVGGVSDLIQNGHNGLLVKAGNPEALADGLLEALRDASKRRALALAGRASLERHRIEDQVQALTSVYQQAAGRSEA